MFINFKKNWGIKNLGMTQSKAAELNRKACHEDFKKYTEKKGMCIEIDFARVYKQSNPREERGYIHTSSNYHGGSSLGATVGNSIVLYTACKGHLPRHW